MHGIETIQKLNQQDSDYQAAKRARINGTALPGGRPLNGQHPSSIASAGSDPVNAKRIAMKNLGVSQD